MIVVAVVWMVGGAVAVGLMVGDGGALFILFDPFCSC